MPLRQNDEENRRRQILKGIHHSESTVLLSVCPVLHAFLVTSVGLLLGFARSPPPKYFRVAQLRNHEWILHNFFATFQPLAGPISNETPPAWFPDSILRLY